MKSTEDGKSVAYAGGGAKGKKEKEKGRKRRKGKKEWGKNKEKMRKRKREKDNKIAEKRKYIRKFNKIRAFFIDIFQKNVFNRILKRFY